MRHYVFCVSPYSGIESYILAEVVGDAADASIDRDSSLAAGLAGARAQILTRSELMAEPEGRRALEAWDDRDDTQFSRENSAILGEEGDSFLPLLRTVGTDMPGKPAVTRLPMDPEHARLITQSRGLRVLARLMVEHAKTRKAEMLAQRSGTEFKIVKEVPGA